MALPGILSKLRSFFPDFRCQIWNSAITGISSEPEDDVENLKMFKTRMTTSLWATAVASFLLVLPSLGQAYASTPQQLALTLSGGITDAGRHEYSSQGGQAVYASVMGQIVDVTSTSFSYKIHANVAGLSATGDLSFQLKGSTIGGAPISMKGSMPLSGMLPVPAETFPIGCTTDCTSEIVAFYLGTANLDVVTGGNHQHVVLPMEMESAFLNPFGGPIILASTDIASSIVVVTTYTQADIHWIDVLSGGTMTGTLDGSPVSGTFSISTMAHDEDLLAGTETEKGTMTFAGTGVPSLDVSGKFQGSSVIPTSNTIDCSYITGFPGTCTLTGFTSQGTFSLSNKATSVVGSYQISWGSPPPTPPALGFTGTAAAVVTHK